jgi:hypothetical protein
MKKKYLLLFVLPYIVLLFSSCTAIRQGLAFLRTPSRFTLINNNVRVENKTDSLFAKNISDIIPHLIDSVEAKHFHKFINTPTVYVCNTNKSFCKYTGSKYPGPRAYANINGVFISPRLKNSKDWREIIYHELSHVILFQYLGIYHYITIPVWFHEGLATYISNGGGSGDVTDSAAIFEILKGNHFYPVARENVLFPKSFSNDKIPAWMKYRQAMLFVKFLKEGKEKEFEKLLTAIFNKGSFPKSIEMSYGEKVSELWDEFLKKSRRV